MVYILRVRGTDFHGRYSTLISRRPRESDTYGPKYACIDGYYALYDSVTHFSGTGGGGVADYRSADVFTAERSSRVFFFFFPFNSKSVHSCCGYYYEC